MGVYLQAEALNSDYEIQFIPRNSTTASIVSGTSMQAEFVVRGSNNFGTRSEAASGLSSAVDAFKSVAGGVSRGASALGGVQASGTPLTLTTAIWQDSEIPVFTITMSFICLRATDPKQSVIKRVNNIMEYVYPAGKTTRVLDFLTAPAGYKVDKNGNAVAGTFDVGIGSWFYGTDMVMLNASFDYAKEINANGDPIYAVGNISFRPHRAITYDQYKQYFISV